GGTAGTRTSACPAMLAVSRSDFLEGLRSHSLSILLSRPLWWLLSERSRPGLRRSLVDVLELARVARPGFFVGLVPRACVPAPSYVRYCAPAGACAWLRGSVQRLP